MTLHEQIIAKLRDLIPNGAVFLSIAERNTVIAALQAAERAEKEELAQAERDKDKPPAAAKSATKKAVKKAVKSKTTKGKK